MDYTFNSVPNYYLCVPSIQNPSIVQPSPVTQKPFENWYFVYPEDIRAVRCTNGSIQYQIVSHMAPIACDNCVIMQPNSNIANNITVEHYNFQQQIALKQLELKMLETQLRGEAVRHLPPYQLVFHNDAATSTTDLTYYNQWWGNSYSTMLKANAYAQLHKPRLSDMQVDQSYATDYKLIPNNSLVKQFGKIPMRVQFSDNVTIFYDRQDSDCDQNSTTEEMKMDSICEKVDETHEDIASTSNSILSNDKKFCE